MKLQTILSGVLFSGVALLLTGCVYPERRVYREEPHYYYHGDHYYYGRPRPVVIVPAPLPPPPPRRW